VKTPVLPRRNLDGRVVEFDMQWSDLVELLKMKLSVTLNLPMKTISLQYFVGSSFILYLAADYFLLL